MLGRIKNGIRSTFKWIKSVDPWAYVMGAAELVFFTLMMKPLIDEGTLNSGLGAVFNVLDILFITASVTGLASLCIALVITDASMEKVRLKDRANQVRSDECGQSLARIRSLMDALRAKVTPTIQEQMNSIADKCGRIQQAIVLDGKQKVASQFLEQYLKPTEAWLTVYTRLKSRDISSAAGAIQQSEEITLPLLSSKLDIFYDQLHVDDIALLSTADVAIELAQKAQIGLEAEALAL